MPTRSIACATAVEVGARQRQWHRVRAAGLWATALAASLSVHADVLFVDTNNAPLEIQAVQRTLAPGEKLWVIPSYERLPAKQREQASRAGVENERLTRLAQDCATGEPGTNPAVCEPVDAGLRDSELNRLAALAGYTGDALLGELDALVADGRRWHSVVVSGHHENGYFAGELVALSKAQMQRLLTVGLQQTGDAPSLFLLGCDTLTPRALNDILLPAVQSRSDLLIVGAEDRAPTKVEPRNIAFIERAFKRAASLHRVRTPDALLREQRLLRANSWPVALWLDGDYVALQGHQSIAAAAPVPEPARPAAPVQDAAAPPSTPVAPAATEAAAAL